MTLRFAWQLTQESLIGDLELSEPCIFLAMR